MTNLVILLITACIFYFFYKRNSSFRERVIKFSMNFWSYKEMRLMVAACFVVYFTSCLIPSPRTSSSVSFPSSLRIEHHHDFSGNLNAPINIRLSDPGYPIKFEIRGK